MAIGVSSEVGIFCHDRWLCE